MDREWLDRKRVLIILIVVVAALVVAVAYAPVQPKRSHELTYKSVAEYGGLIIRLEMNETFVVSKTVRPKVFLKNNGTEARSYPSTFVIEIWTSEGEPVAGIKADFLWTVDAVVRSGEEILLNPTNKQGEGFFGWAQDDTDGNFVLPGIYIYRMKIGNACLEIPFEITW